MEQNGQKNEAGQTTEGASLEGDSSGSSPSPEQTTNQAPLPEKPQGPLVKRVLSKLNIYLLLFILVLFLAGAIAMIVFLSSHGNKSNTVKTQSLTQDTLKQLADSDVTVGQPKQVLNVQSNAVFAGKVLIRDSLEVAGTIQVGSALNVPGITVSGNSIFEQVQIDKTLQVAGDSALQGQLAVKKSLTVAGGGTFGGAITAPQLSVNSLQINGDFNLTHHITAGGATPSRSNGSALGSSGSASVSGSDTAGTINVNTGGSASAGCFITINFVQKFNSTPHVLVTPVGASAGGLGVYVNRTTTSFSVCAENTPPSNASFSFDYFVLD